MKPGTPYRRRTLAIALSAAYAFGPQSAFANPNDAQVVSGQAVIQSQGSQLSVTNSAGAIINWRGFSIGAGETTRFIQPSATSAVLNRVVGPDMSQLLGQLQSNGQVYLINPNGIVVGASAHIDTNSFVASTLDIADADFLAGKLRFLERSGAGGIRNDGLITAGPGGRIALIAPNIQNNGIIQAPDGNILLAAGRKLEITSLDMDGIRFEIQAPTDSVLNLGKLLAENGAVRAFAGTLRNSGEIEAKRMAVDAGGNIVLSGSNSVTLTRGSVTRADGATGGTVLVQSRDGTTRIDGQVSAAGTDGVGGDVRILGELVALDGGAQIVASGSRGGGQILVGGDYQGSNVDVQNAKRVNVAVGATLQADATVVGDGGHIIVWADENTRYHGDLSARGGAQGGNGGFAEVSGKQNLEFTGGANLTAASGKAGSLLLDPLDILVSLNSGILPSVVDEFTDFASNVVTVSPLTLAAVGGSVVLQAMRDIYVRDAIKMTAYGAGLTATAGGALFNAGSIINTAGITTNAGAVSLRGQAISGAGGITTAGGAIDLTTAGALNYTGAISSGGGTVVLASQNSSVNNVKVDSGSGNITVSARGISGGSYTTSGSVSMNATAGSISVNDVTANVLDLTATSNIYATVNATERVNAAASGSLIQLSSSGNAPLRVGTVTGKNNIFPEIDLYAYNGLEQASGGLLTTSYLSIYAGNGAQQSGSLAAPLLIASPSALVQPQINVYGLAAPAHLAFVGAPTLGGLILSGTVAGLAGTTISGAGNLSSVSFGRTGSVLDAMLVSSSGLSNGFGLIVSDGSLHASTLTLSGTPLPGASATLSANGGVTVDTMTGGSLSITAKGAVTIGSATTTGSAGIYVSTQACSNTGYVACAASSPIVAGTLAAGGTGSVKLRTYDNGDVTATSVAAGLDVKVEAGQVYALAQGSFPPTQPTTNNIVLGTVVAGRYADVIDYAQGNVSIGSLTAADRVGVQAGTSYRDSNYSTQQTSNSISVGNVEPSGGAAGNFTVNNLGIGNLTVTGAVDRSASGAITLNATAGSVSATGALNARDSINVIAGVNGAQMSTALLGSMVAGASGNVTVQARGDISFDSVTANGVGPNYGKVTLNSSLGSVLGNLANTGADIVGTTVTLHAGQDIGAVSKAVTVNTIGTIDVASDAGQFHVAVTDGANKLSPSTIRLSASAPGIGNGNSATFTSLGLDVTAASDGTTITIIEDLVRSAGTLNEFSFSATGASGLNFGDIALTTGGFNQLFLSAGGALTQLLPGLTNNISAGNINLAAGSNPVTLGNVTSSSAGANSVGNQIYVRGGSITAGALSAPGMDISGTDLTLGAVSSVGTNRGYFSSNVVVPRLGSFFQYWTDEMHLTATSGAVTTSGNISSQTSAYVSGNGVTVNSGNGTISGGHSAPSYYSDTVNVGSGTGTLSVADMSAYDVTVSGTTLNTGNVAADRYLNFGDTSTANVSTLDLSGGNSLTLNSGGFSTGNLSAGSGALTITANANGPGTYMPSSAISLSSGLFPASGNISITAPMGIDLVSGGASTVTANTVTLSATAGNIVANLASATNLTLVTGGTFAVTSASALTALDVTADGLAVGAAVGMNPGSSVRAGPTLQQSMEISSGGGMLALDLASNSQYLNAAYHESNSGVTDITLNTTGGAFGNGGQIQVIAPMAAIVAQSVTLAGGASLDLRSDDGAFGGGGIDLQSVSGTGGFVNVYSSGGTINLSAVNSGGGDVTAQTDGFAANINLQSVVTLGGSATFVTGSGNIVAVSSGPHIDTHTALAAQSGNVTLSAAGGSIGSAGTPIIASGAPTLDVTARDTIAVDVAGTGLSNLFITTQGSGSGSIDIQNNTNFGSLSVTRSLAGDVTLSGASPSLQANVFSLTALDGDLIVASDIGNVVNLTLNAQGGSLGIAASGGVARSIAASGTLSLSAGQDIAITAGSAASESVSVSGGSTYLSAGRDLVLQANGDSAQLISNAAFNSQSLSAGRDLLIGAGAAAGAFAAVTDNGPSYSYQSLSAQGNLSVLGGSGAGAYAAVGGSTIYQQTLNAGGNLLLQAGAGAGAFAQVAQVYPSSGYQYVSAGGNLAVLGGNASSGQGTGSYAQLSGDNQNLSAIGGNVLIVGGTAADNSARVSALAGQSLGTITGLSGSVTDSITVLGGSGDRAFARIVSASGQNVYAGRDRFNSAATGAIAVLGGTGTDATAEITATVDQNIGSQANYCSYYCADPTGSVLVQGGSGSAAFGSIKAGGQQNVYAGGSIEVRGAAGAGALAQILSTAGAQNIGSTATSNNDATDAIVVQAGSGGTARIQAKTTQSIMTGGDLSVVGGTGSGMTASIESMAGSQTIGNTSMGFGNDPSGSITVTAGSGTGAAAFIQAATGQTIDAGGTIALTGSGASRGFAEMATSGGTQTIGNSSGNRDHTESIFLTGGSAADAYARMSSAGFQSLQTAASLILAGGAGNNSGAMLVASTGQNLTVLGALSMVGGSGSAPGLNETAIRNSTSGSQSIYVGGNMSVTGGGFGADTWVKQNGTGNQGISVGGTLALLSPAATPSTGVTSIEALGSNQSISVGGAMTIDNQGGWLTYVAAAGTQNIGADAIGISLSSASPVSSPFAGITATGNQFIVLHGSGADDRSATISIYNTSSLTGSLAAISSAADQTILMDYNSAGLVQIGSANGQGRTQIYAGGKHTMVAGELLIQGGASVAATAAIMVPNDAAVISTIYGPITLQGGSLGAALIDPPQLDMVSNNGVFLLAGSGSSASATIDAGIFNLAATNGDLSLISTAATAAIRASVFNYFGGGNVNLTGGTVTVSKSGTITITGICYNCDTNLFGPFSVFAYVPPPTDYGALVTSDLLALADLGKGLFDAYYNEDGQLELRNRRLNQCY